MTSQVVPAAMMELVQQASCEDDEALGVSTLDSEVGVLDIDSIETAVVTAIDEVIITLTVEEATGIDTEGATKPEHTS